MAAAWERKKWGLPGGAWSWGQGDHHLGAGDNKESLEEGMGTGSPSQAQSHTCLTALACLCVNHKITQVPDGTVLLEFRKGFKIGDKLLRPAMVKVGALLTLTGGVDHGQRLWRGQGVDHGQCLWRGQAGRIGASLGMHAGNTW